MTEPGGESGQANVHVAWRMAQARRAARAYAGNPKLAALAVAGSVGSGLADRFSDLELDCYWFTAPGDLDRTSPVEVVPDQLAERLALLSAGRTTEALRAAEALLTDIVALSEARTDADLSAFREELAARRRVIDPPADHALPGDDSTSLCSPS